MSRKIKMLWLCCVGAMLLTAVSVRQIPRWVKSTVEKEPGVAVNHLNFTLDGIHMSLSVDKGWVVAELPDVVVDWGQRVTVQGGQVDLRRIPDPRTVPTKTTGASEREVRFENLTVRHKNDVEVIVEGVSGSRASVVTWKSATVKHARAVVVVGSGTAGPSKNDPVVVKSMSVTPTFEVPYVADGAWQLEDVRFTLEDRTLRVGKVQIGGSTGFEADKVVLFYDDVLGKLLVRVDRFVLRQPILAKTPLTFPQPLMLDFPVHDVDALERGDVDVNITYGKLALLVNPARLEARALPTGCQDYVDSLPDEMRKSFEKLEFTGNLRWQVQVRPTPDLKLYATCKARCDSPKLTALRKPFTYMAYRPDGVTRFERTSGPGSKDWVPIGAMGQYLPTAAICLEDPGFLVHGGVSAAALRNSLVDNVDKGRFVRGGSTIAMQLARNLWLGRGKTLGRKVQEMFLAWGLAGCFTHDQILELYLNVVEFGPDTYGIAAGSQLWFDRHADALSAPEAFYLIKRLPRPGSYPPPDDPTMERITGLMRLFVETEKIPGFWVPQDVSGLDLSGWNQ